MVRMGMPMDGQTKLWLAVMRIAQRTIAGMYPILVRRTQMEMGYTSIEICVYDDNKVL